MQWHASTRRTVATDGGRSQWTRDHAAQLRRTDDTTTSIIYPPDEKTADGVHVWDTWLLRDRSGEFVEIDGYRVVVALTAPDDLLPGKRHDVATLRYFYSEDGTEWTNGGPVFAGSEPFGSRQWAGSALYDDGDLYCYYTAAGSRGEEDLSYHQRICAASGGTVDTSGDGLTIEGPFDHEVLMTPDGEYYETEDQSRGMIYTFRDPWFFEDPESGRTFLLFEGNTPVTEGSDACGGDPEQQVFNGCIGIAESPSGDPMEWEMLPPILDGVCVNQELERPHVVVRDDTYYLFVSSHEHTFAPGLDGFDALYGFAGDSIFGPYEPLNDSGLVVTNPPSERFQSYSWMVYDHGDELLVTSFLNYFNLEGRHIDEVALLPEEEQFNRFGGTLAPTVRVALDGTRTRVLGTLDHGHLPLKREALPGFWWEREGETGGADYRSS